MSISSLIQPEGDAPTEANVLVTESDEQSVGQSPEPEPTQPAQPVGDEFLEALLTKLVPVTQTRKTLKVLIYSDPGAGKTTFLGGAPNNMVIDVEGGLASINNHPDLVASNVQAIPYKTFEGLEGIINKLHEDPEPLRKFETISIDSISELHKRGLAEVVEREYRRNPVSTNRYVAETEHHTENNEHIRRLVSSLRDLNRNLIMTCHARTIEPKNLPAKTFPDFSEKLANTIAGIMDIVGYMYIKEVEGQPRRILRLHSNGTIAAKTRIGGFPEEIIDPSWDKLWNTFQSQQGK